MGGQPQQSMGGQPRQMGGQPRQQMGGPVGRAGAQQGRATGGRQLPVQPVGAGDIAETDVVTADRDDPLTGIVERMAQEDVGTVVIEEDGRPIGLVTDRKIALSLTDRTDISDMTAGDVMTEDLVTVSEDTTVFDVTRTLGDHAIRRAPVVDEDGKLTGIVSIDDMLVLLATEMDQLGDVIERQIERF
jgi:CBS domain-containing protein